MSGKMTTKIIVVNDGPRDVEVETVVITRREERLVVYRTKDA